MPDEGEGVAGAGKRLADVGGMSERSVADLDDAAGDGVVGDLLMLRIQDVFALVLPKAGRIGITLGFPGGSLSAGAARPAVSSIR